MKTPESSHAPDLTLVFSCSEHRTSNFRLQTVTLCLDKSAMWDMSVDQTTYLHLFIFTVNEMCVLLKELKLQKHNIDSPKLQMQQRKNDNNTMYGCTIRRN